MNGAEPTRDELAVAESLVNQYAIAVLLTHIAPAEIGRAAERITESEFEEWAKRLLGPSQHQLAERLVAVGKESLIEVLTTFSAAGETRPWLG